MLTQHRTDRHLEHHDAPVAAVSPKTPLPRLAVVLCGTKADVVDNLGERPVSGAEAQSFAQSNGLHCALMTSAKTGEGASEAFQALLVAVLNAEEETEAELAVASRAAPADVSWSLCGAETGAGAVMTAPRGLRPHEPARGAEAPELVEVITAEGVAISARPLVTCLSVGLLHRGIHVWLIDPQTGGMLLRRYAMSAPKHPGRWGPTGHGEVLFYGLERNASGGPHSSELSTHAATRTLSGQTGVYVDPSALELWLSCTSCEGRCNELLDVYVTTIGTKGLPPLTLRSGEAAEWVHFTDVFGGGGRPVESLFHIEDTYRTAMVQKMKSRILHASMHA